jgi:Family of unknown function (DUF5675)
LFKVTIRRRHSFVNSIGGDLSVNGRFICKTLELAWLWNAKDRSCVPPSTYFAFIRRDKKDGWRVQLTGILGNRTGVQIHIGNYPREIKGCVLVGERYTPDAIWHSAAAYRKFETSYANHRNEPVMVEFVGLLATPWGDFEGRRFRDLA